MMMNSIEDKIVDLGYVFCIIYLSLFTFLYKITGFAYTTVGIMGALVVLDVILSRKVCIDKAVFWASMYILHMFFLAFLNYGSDETEAYFKSFLVLGTVGFYFGNKKANNKRVIIISALLFSAYMFLGGGIKQLQIDYFNMSCAMIPGICSLFLASIILIDDQKKTMGILFLCVGMYLLWVLITLGSRSSVVSIGIFLIILLWYYYDLLWFKIAILCAGSGMLALLFNIEKTLLGVSNYLSKRGIEIYVITKSIEKIHGASGITSGRIDIQKHVFENLDLLNVVFGKGISSFEATYGTYPHNLILNLFVDYGLIGVVFFSVVIIHTIKILKTGSKEEKMLIILLLSSTVSPLLFSFTYWRYPAVFLYIAMVLSKKKKIIS